MPEKQEHPSIWQGPVFFIVGCSRSGTTWVRNIFNAHPSVIVGEESYFFCDITPPIRRAFKAKTGPIGLHRYVSEEGLARAVELFFRRVAWERAQQKPSALWFGEKTPAHIHRLDDIVDVLPDAKFIHVVRDVRDVVASMLDAARSWALNPALTATRAAEVWRDAVSKGLAAEERWPERVLRIRYEDLVVDRIDSIQRLFSFLGISIVEGEAKRIALATEFEKFTHGRRAGEPGGEGKFYRLGMVEGWSRSLSALDCKKIMDVAGELLNVLGYCD